MNHIRTQLRLVGIEFNCGSCFFSSILLWFMNFFDHLFIVVNPNRFTKISFCSALYSPYIRLSFASGSDIINI